MRKLLLIGTTGLVVALGAVNANAIPVNPEASPYVLLNQQAQPSNGVSSVIEGRSAFTSGGDAAQSTWHGRSYY